MNAANGSLALILATWLLHSCIYPDSVAHHAEARCFFSWWIDRERVCVCVVVGARLKIRALLPDKMYTRRKLCTQLVVLFFSHIQIIGFSLSQTKLLLHIYILRGCTRWYWWECLRTILRHCLSNLRNRMRRKKKGRVLPTNWMSHLTKFI